MNCGVRYYYSHAKLGKDLPKYGSEIRKSCDFTTPCHAWTDISTRFSKMSNCLNRKSYVKFQILTDDAVKSHAERNSWSAYYIQRFQHFINIIDYSWVNDVKRHLICILYFENLNISKKKQDIEQLNWKS